MKGFTNFIVKRKWLIVIITLLLMLPSILGYILTDINYDILVYLPSDIETLKGERILTDDFNMGAFSIVITDNMNSSEILKLEDKIRKIDSVEKVISVEDITGTAIPIEMLPNNIIDKVYKNGNTLILVTFNNSTSDDLTLAAVEEMRSIVSDNVKIGGMSAMVLDTKELFNSEMLLYVVIAVILCILVLELFLDSYIVPILLMLNIGIAILFNMGSNIFLGNISYITKAIAAVLQLGVTTDFSIFLYHKYESLKKKMDNEEAMKEAIKETFSSVFGSSLTTIAGFLALCTMKLTLGVDIGIVMAKGVLFGVLCVLTLFPALLLIFDKKIDSTKHKELLPKFNRIKEFVLKKYVYIFIVFIILLLPSFFAQSKTPVYYKLDESIPSNYGYSEATSVLKNDYNIVSQEIIIVPVEVEDYKIDEMINEIKEISGIDLVLSPSSLTKYGLNEIIPSDIKNIYETDNYKLILVTSDYDIATDELNDQINSINEIVKKYDDRIIVAGEGPLMKDLVTTTDIDFTNVNYTSIGVIFILMLIVLKSLTLPILLVTTIEFAIFINMGVPYFTGTEIPFIASVVIGTIQLGATIDYAILMTTKYLTERSSGKNKSESVRNALDNSISSIFVSAMCFFGATIGVGLVSKIDMIGSLCRLISRGAIISMIVVIMVVPSILLIFDKLIIKTTYMKGNDNMKKKFKKKLACLLVLALSINPTFVSALTKDETVYTKLNSDGSVKSTLVNEHLINDSMLESINDTTNLKNIVNLSGENKFTLENNRVIWNANKNDVFYSGITDSKLPIGVKITYKLDNKDINLDDLIGKKGHVDISIKYNNTLKNYVKVNGKTEVLYTPFVVTTITSISNINNSNIKVTNGRVVNNGINSTVIGMTSPGLYESIRINEFKDLDNITISLDTTKFELSNIYSVAASKVLEDQDLSIFNKVNSLYSNIDLLKESINKISDGNSLIKNNMDMVAEKLEEIKNGTISVDSGLTDMIKELNNVKIKLNNKDLSKEFEQLNTLISTNEKTINQMNDSALLIITKYKENNLNNKTYSDIEAMESIIGKDNVNNLISIKYQYENNMETNSNLLKLIDSNNKAIGSLKTSLAQTSLEVTELINTLTIYLTQIENGTKELSDGLNKLTIGVNTLDSKMGELNAGINEFNNQGITKLASYATDVKTISDKVDALVKLSENYSFSKGNKDVNSSTKFILVVDGKTAPKEEKKATISKKKESFWDRLVNLFK